MSDTNFSMGLYATEGEYIPKNESGITSVPAVATPAYRKTRNAMLDVECFGIGARSALAAIGLVSFDIESGEILDEFYVKVDIESSIKAGATLDAPTIKWWLKQTTAAQLEVSGTVGEEGVYNIQQALVMLIEFVQKIQVKPGALNIWGNGANFDPVIIAEAFTMLGLNAPYPFWKVRDVRTVVGMGREIGIDPKTDLVALGTPHKALEDCRLQVQYTSEIWKALLAPHPRNRTSPNRSNR